VKNINISTKITLLILLISLVAVSAVGFFTYDHIQKTNQEKYLVNLNVIADNRAGYFSSYFDKVVIALRALQESDVIKSGGASSTTSPSDDPLAAMAETSAEESTEESSEPVSTGSGNSLVEYLNKQKEIFGFKDIIITNLNGGIIASTDGKSGNFLDPDGATFHEGAKGIYFSIIRPDSTQTYAAAPVTGSDGEKLIIVRVDLKEPYKILNDRKGLGETGEVVLAQYNATLRKIQLVSPKSQRCLSLSITKMTMFWK
jgi:hypothetical protein